MYDIEELYSEIENEKLKQALSDEHQAELELKLEQDEKPPQVKEPPEKKKLKRDLRAEALARMESAARTTSDFENVIAWWDRFDSNRERRERYHEVLRSGDVIPLDYNALPDNLVLPYSLNSTFSKQIRKGDFIDVIFNCPYEIHQLVTAGYLSKILDGLSENHKEILFLNIVHALSTKAVGDIRGQSDRNIRKVKTTALKKIHKKLLPILKSNCDKGLPLTVEERIFLDKNITALDDNKSS